MKFALGALLSGIITLAGLTADGGTAEAAATRGLRVAKYALLQVGDRYRFGAKGPGSWDCSGLAGGAWARVGRKLPRTTRGLIRVGKPVRRSQLKPGDLVFTSPGHVQVYAGGGKVVEAANPRRGVVLTRMWGFYAARRP